jgi:hypothetical protein
VVGVVVPPATDYRRVFWLRRYAFRGVAENNTYSARDLS